MKRLIFHYYVLDALLYLGRGMANATYVLFLQRHGLSLFQVNLVNVCYFITVIAAEMPTGVFADVFGRKRSFLLAFTIYTLAMALYGQATGFSGFIIAEIIAGVAFTFFSGAFDAWITEELKHLGANEELIQKMYRGNERIMYGSWAICALASGWLAQTDFTLPWLVGSVVLALGGLYTAVFMPAEQAVAKHHSWQDKVHASQLVARAGLRQFGHSATFRLVVIGSAIITFSLQAANMQWQPFFKPLVANMWHVGQIGSLIPIGLFVGTILVRRKDLANPAKQLPRLVMIIGIAMLVAASGSNLWLILPPFFLHEVARGAFGVSRKQLVNDSVGDGAHRATIASVESAINHGAGLFGLILSGLSADYLGIPTTWKICGLLMIVGSLWLYRRK